MRAVDVLRFGRTSGVGGADPRQRQGASESGEQFSVELPSGTTSAFLVRPYADEASLPEHVSSAVVEEGIDLRQDGLQHIVSAKGEEAVDVSVVRRGHGLDFCAAEDGSSSPSWYESGPEQTFRAAESEISPDVYSLLRA